MTTLWRVLNRRKVIDPDSTDDTPLARVLNTFDLTALGVGSTLGVGVYVLAGQVAKNTAGPAVIISFLIAAIASVFAGLCYAEFGARTPKAGSAYVYSYLCVGEFIAFVIGWNLILEYIIGSASVAKGLSSYVDNLWNGTMSKAFIEVAPMDLPYLARYFDFFAFTIPIVLAIALAFGMRESSLINNIFTSLNIGVVLFVIIAGALNAHWDNWFIDPRNVRNVTNATHLGEGGFFPFGIEGVLKGAATCFYGFVGFDCIATTGEEVKNPKKAIPISIILSLLIIFLAYFGTSTVTTLMIPYYEQDPTAPIPYAFQSIHWNTAALIVSIGAIFGLYASLFGAMFPLPRILYAMASDGLIFRIMGQVNERFRTPVIGTILAGLFTGFMAAVFDLESLVNMMSIGTLLAYTIVASCVLLLRYSEDEKGSYEPVSGSSDSEEVEGYAEVPNDGAAVNDSEETMLTSGREDGTGYMRNIFNFGREEIPNKMTETIVSIDIFIYCVLCFMLGLSGLHLKHKILEGEIYAICIVSAVLLLIALTILSIASQPVSRKVLSFQVPWVPLIPALSIFFNIYLMIMLDIATWVRFVVWMIIGIPIFLLTRKSVRRRKYSQEISHRSYLNSGFYDDNLVLSNGSETFSNQETMVVTQEEKKLPPLRILEGRLNDRMTLSTSRVLESLDQVIDSFGDGSASPAVLSDDIVSSALTPTFAEDPSVKSLDSANLPEENLTQPSRVEIVCSVSPQAGAKDVDSLKRVSSVESDDTDDDEGFEIISLPGSDASYTTTKSEIVAYHSAEDDETNFTPPPPPPPPMSDFEIFNTKPQTNYRGVDDVPKESTKRVDVDKPNKPLVINAKSLNSVKLRHVERPSLKEVIEQPVHTVQLRHVRRPSLEEPSSESKTLPRMSNSKTGAYNRSKSVNANREDEFGTTAYTQAQNTLPRINISRDAINSVKLRKVLRPSISMVEIEDKDQPDSVVFGSEDFEKFKRELNDKLKQPVNIPREPSFMGSRKIVGEKPINIDKDSVIEDNIDVGKARATIKAEIDAKLNILKSMK